MAWCVECWSQDRKTVTATKVLDAEDLCDLHYRKALGEGLPAPRTSRLCLQLTALRCQRFS